MIGIKERFEQHKTGYRNKKGHKLSSNIVQKYGLYFRPSLYNHIDPLPTQHQALQAENGLHYNCAENAMWFGLIEFQPF